MVLYKNNSRYDKYEYKIENEFEEDIINNYKVFFGNKTIYIDAKRKITSKLLGNTIPDGFLIDIKDEDNPEFYIVEAELYKHDFYSHIFPQITKYFAFYKNYESRKELVDKIYSIINSDNELLIQIKNIIKKIEIYKYLSDIIENSQNILLIIDKEKRELPEIINTYTDTWGKMVKVQIITKYINKDESIFTMEPEFDKIEYSLINNIDEINEEKAEISEEYHLENVTIEVKEIYSNLKEKLLQINKEVRFNPQKYYISIINERNVLYLKIRKKKIRIIIMLPEEEVRDKLNANIVKTLSKGVQDFYNGKCCAVDIENKDIIDDVIEVANKILVKKENT